MSANGEYLLGPQDALDIHVAEEPDIPVGPYEVNLRGDIEIPQVGTVHAAGKSLLEVSAELKQRLKTILQNPIVTVSVATYRSQRVSVLGAVNTPGVHQIQGRKTLYELISEAGGLRSDAGDTIVITRQKQWGAIPLVGTKDDETGDYSVARVKVQAVMNASDPQQNIAVMPNDVITVPKALLIYVIGAVNRSGGFPLAERQSMTVLQALALAEGLGRTASAKHARILTASTTGPRVERDIDVRQIMSGKLPDPPLQPEDILFIPNSAAKSVSYRGLDALIATGSGVAIYHPF